jgi:hypothetical protein
MTERDQFEKWASTIQRCNLTRRIDGSYVYDVPAIMWETWRAARLLQPEPFAWACGDEHIAFSLTYNQLPNQRNVRALYLTEGCNE